MPHTPLQSERGYIALLSVILTAAVLSMLAVSSSVRVWSSQQQGLLSWAKHQSIKNADACVRLAALRLSVDATPFGQTTFQIKDQSCTVVEAANFGGVWRITTRAVTLGAGTNLVAEVDGTSFAVTMESEPP